MGTNRNPESASTPISAGGWKYNHDNDQDRADFANYNAGELAALQRNRNYDFSDHPTMVAERERSDG